jgi:UDP-glucose 4-epimerase
VKIVIAGGAGFIGSSLTRELLRSSHTIFSELVVVDNFSSGTKSHLSEALADSRLKLIEGDLKDIECLLNATHGANVIFHFASNPDIAKAASDPTIDFTEGTVLTQNLLEAARANNVGVFIYASGSGVYGDFPDFRLREDFGPLEPISPYGASKLAGEALVSAYCHMFGMSGRSLRFANVIGSNQTHGVTYDFVNKLQENQEILEVLGDGTQTKPYIHVDDIVRALKTGLSDAFTSGGYRALNASTDDEIQVGEIAEICIKKFGLTGVTNVRFGTSPRGWTGDVPKVSLDSSVLRSLGWQPELNSRQAVEKAIEGYMELLGIGLKNK